MKLKKFVLNEAYECPLKNSLFGEMPGGGGFSSNTEYEIGAMRMAEAAHCILGSLSKYISRDDKPLWVEKGHIQEEMNIIEEAMVDYSRSLYIDRVRQKVREGNKYGEMSIESIMKAAPKLKKKARSARTRLNKDLPKAVYDVAIATYNFLIELSNQMYDSVAHEPLTSAYRSPKLIRTMNILKKAVKHLLSLPDDATVEYLKAKGK